MDFVGLAGHSGGRRLLNTGDRSGRFLIVLTKERSGLGRRKKREANIHVPEARNEKYPSVQFCAL